MLREPSFATKGKLDNFRIVGLENLALTGKSEQTRVRRTFNVNGLDRQRW